MHLLLTAIQVPPEVAAQQGLGPFALLFMLVSMAAVTTLTVWCYWQILGNRQHFDPDGTGPAHSPVAGEVDQTGKAPPLR